MGHTVGDRTARVRARPTACPTSHCENCTLPRESPPPPSPPLPQHTHACTYLRTYHETTTVIVALPICLVHSSTWSSESRRWPATHVIDAQLTPRHLTIHRDAHSGWSTHAGRVHWTKQVPAVALTDHHHRYHEERLSVVHTCMHAHIHVHTSVHTHAHSHRHMHALCTHVWNGLRS